MSDSPNLSDLSEGRFDDINGGHRTSTPNMSKQKRSASLYTPEITPQKTNPRFLLLNKIKKYTLKSKFYYLDLEK